MSEPLPAAYAFKFNRLHWLVIALAAALFLWGGLAAEWEAGEAWMKWSSLVLGAVTVLVCVASLLRPGRVRLDANGVETRELIGKSRYYRWADISEVDVVELRFRGIVSYRTVGFDILKAPAYMAINSKFYGRHMMLNAMWIAGDKRFACAVMNAFRARALGLPQPQA